MLAGRRHERLGLLVDGRLVVALEHAAQIRQRGLDLGAFAAVDLVAEILERLLDGVHQLIGAIARIHQLAEFLVFFRVRLGVASPCA